jgi:antigen flippase
MVPQTMNDSSELTMTECACATISEEQRLIVAPPQERAQKLPAASARGSYGQILKSSALVGGAQAANIAIGVVRTKAMAVLLGPSGFGLFGLYGSISNLTQSIAGMGINSSGVRQIAEAVGSGDQARIARTAAVLKRTSVVLGLLGAVLLLAFSGPVSKLTFGTKDQVGAVALLSIAVFFTLVSGGQGALIQGMRRITDLAKMNVLAALFGVCAGIPLVYFFREKGVVPSLISVAAVTILTSWWYSRKVGVPPARVRFSEIREEASELLKLGSAFMASSLMTMGTAYFVRVTLLQKIGFEATGLYQSAWTLGGLYVGFILQAMGADFYPRLTASIHNHDDCNRLVNEQTLIGLLLAGPGVVATLTFAPLVVALFYSAKFGAAVGILRWICLGVMLQVITWPMGFVIVAKGRSVIFFLAELAWTIVAIALAWVGIQHLGLVGAGIAFFGSYVFHYFLIYPIVRALSGFRWSAANRKVGLFFGCLVLAVFGGLRVLPLPFAVIAGAAAIVLSASYSIWALIKIVPSDELPRPIRRMLLALGFSRLIPN